ncbi:hypothetical protein [Methanobacterium congolense]|uniref:Uncharacterized protein n=1 Tax=Methanobacterium congolense TaxID=118062 RepID=A0A1D3L1E0_9EURY|nr:hypothetical protein [Methanobacterium congolense]SCG85494.1 putative protein [Methanobacterium congolense]
MGSLTGALFSLFSTYADLSGIGILLSNVVAGFTANYVAESKDDYILVGGVSGTISSVLMVAIDLFLPKSPWGFVNLSVFGFLSVAVSISGGGFLLGALGIHSEKVFRMRSIID